MIPENEEGKAKLIVDGDLLSTDTIHGVLTNREDEQGRLRACLAPVQRGQPPFNAWLHGPPGSGKTALARLLLEEVRGSGAGVGAYVNCWQHRSLYSVLRAIMDQLELFGGEGRDANVKLKRVCQALRGKAFALVLDDIDRPMPTQREEIIDGLLRLPKVCLVCTAVSDQALVKLDESVRSRLSPYVIEAPGYSVMELMAILADRAERALLPGVWTPVLLRRIAGAAGGDARLAIQLLRQAAVAAEEAGCARITARFVKTPARQWPAIRQDVIHFGLSEHAQILQALAKQHAPVNTTTLASIYRAQCQAHGLQPMAGRTVRKYLGRLVAAGVLTVSQGPETKGGRLVGVRQR